MLENIEILDELIVGRVVPHIYAFSTDTVPNYLKIGDTYRPVSVRLNEWKKYFPTLKEEYKEKATINDNIFFRDYAVHQYLETELDKKRLMPNDINGIYYSNEFFKDTDIIEIEDAINDIKDNFEKRINKYKYYNSKNRLPETYTYASTGEWKPRPNQQKTINNFINAFNNGRKNLLMYAVMRFGKSFTSLCCAKEINAKTVLVVSAKADVREEWKKTVQQADNFNKNYIFLTGKELSSDEHIVKNSLKSGKRVVIFLTLQDLQGKSIKNKHKEIFGNIIDLLIIDETHFGARAEKYGNILKDNNYILDTKEKYADDDYVKYTDINEELKVLEAKIKLHLSGTPYRILMGSEFAKEDIIAFYQFTDIVAEQEKWDSEHIFSDDVKEWDNPYYGFPQMIRFAFNPSKKAKEKLAKLKANGNTYAFSALFKPNSIKKSNNGSHKKFIYEKEVLDLFEVIDGSKEDDELLGFLDYDKIKNGNMCRHMVCVLPYCASCDALEKLLYDNRDKFKNLNDYTIINISGVDKPNEYKSIDVIKEKIKKCEENNKKTLTLTVNRMLTGSTVKQWDTMLFLKDTASPQEYDQAIFRLQNQYIKSFIDESGEEIKFNMKPQTILVDFDPYRMFSIQEQKSLIYNAYTKKGGNQRLEERIKEELKISPIVTINKNKIIQVEAADILNVISAYSKDRGVIDETLDIPVDMSLLNIDVIKSAIEVQAELGSKKGLQIDAYMGDENDFDDEDNDDKNNNGDSNDKDGKETEKNNVESVSESDNQQLENKFRMYYSRLLFYAFLSEDILKSLDDILSSFDNIDNIRIAHNLSLNKDVLQAIRQNINSFILNQLDYKIQNINALSHDETVEPVERAVKAINKFGKLSESEIPTPLNIANDMIELLPDKCFYNLSQEDVVILDIASKIGEFAIAICERANKLGIDFRKIKSSVLSIPTSTVAYEFTRKIYSVLGLDIDCIAKNFTSYNLLDVKIIDNDGNKTDKIDYEKVSNILKQNKLFSEITLDDEIKEDDNKMKFEAIVGNPPYQEESKTDSTSNGQNPRRNIFHFFQIQAMNLSGNTVLIFPGIRWIHQSGKGLKKFGCDLINNVKLKKIIYYPNSSDVFSSTDISDGISIVQTDNEKVSLGFEYKYISANKEITLQQENPGDELLLIDPRDVEIVNKVKQFTKEYKLPYLHDSIFPRTLFGIESDFIEKNKKSARLYTDDDAFNEQKEIKILVNDKAGPGGRSMWFVVDRDTITKNKQYISEWQVVVSSAHPGGQEGRDNQISIIDNKSVFGRSRVALKSFKTKEEAENFLKFANSTIIKYMFLMTDESLSSLAKLVPDISDYTKNNTIINFDNTIDSQFYKILQLTEEEIKYINKKVNPT